jgi:hypothetical protein
MVKVSCVRYGTVQTLIGMSAFAACSGLFGTHLPLFRRQTIHLLATLL